MRVVRSWPEKVPQGRAHVVDSLPRFVMQGYDYRGLGDLDDDVLLVEWDIAVGREDWHRFRGHALRAPDAVVVAPYLLYTSTARSVPLRRPLWCHRRYEPGGQSMRHVQEGEPSCHTWGLGLAYLPRDVIRGYLDAWPVGHVNDVGLSAWHHANVTEETPIAWDVRPVHLHYNPEE